MRVNKKYLVSLFALAMVLVESPVLDTGSRVKFDSTNTKRLLTESEKENMRLKSNSAVLRKSLEHMIIGKEELNSTIAILSRKITKEACVGLEVKDKQAEESLAKKDRDEAIREFFQKLYSAKKASVTIATEAQTAVGKIFEVPQPSHNPTLSQPTTTQLILEILLPQVAKRNGKRFYVYDQSELPLFQVKKPKRPSSLPSRIFTGDAGLVLNMAVSFSEKPKPTKRAK